MPRWALAGWPQRLGGIASPGPKGRSRLHLLDRATEWRLAPAVGFEPTTKRLTAARSTTELRRSGGRERSGRADGVRVAGAGVGAARQDSTERSAVRSRRS